MPEPGGALAAIDYTIVVVYMLGILGIGAFFGKYIRSAGDFFLAGKALPFWAIGMSIVVSDIGAVDMVAGAGAAYEHGIAQANWDWLGSMPAMIIAAFVFVPYYWRSGVYTIPEFLGRRYNQTIRYIQAVIWVLYLTSMLAVMLWTSAVFLQTQLGWSTELAIWVTVGFVGFYTVSGGLAAVVMTDAIQMIVMFVGAGALLVLCVWNAGGWEPMKEAVLALGAETENHFTLLLPHDAATPYPWTGIVFGLGIVLSTGYFVGNQAIVQRVLGARSEWDAKAGMIFGCFLKLFIPILIMLPGLSARALHPELEKADEAIPILIRDLFPPGLKGLMFAAFLAALMSSVDSYLNSAVTVLLSDLFRLRRTEGGEGQIRGVNAGRFLTALLIIAAGFLAPNVPKVSDTIYTSIQTIFSFFQGPTLAILLLGILWRRTTGIGALCGLLLGLCVTGTLNFIGEDVFPSEEPFLFVSFWSFLFSLAVTILVSLVTPREPDEKIRGLVYGDVLHDPQAQEILQRRVDGQ